MPAAVGGDDAVAVEGVVGGVVVVEIPAEGVDVARARLGPKARVVLLNRLMAETPR